MSPIIKEFLTTDIGLMSLAVVLTTIVIIGYIALMFLKKSGRE